MDSNNITLFFYQIKVTNDGALFVTLLVLFQLALTAEKPHKFTIELTGYIMVFFSMDGDDHWELQFKVGFHTIHML